MTGGTLLRLREKELEKRVEECEAKLRELRGSLKAIRDWLEELEGLHAVLAIKVYELEREVGDSGE